MPIGVGITGWAIDSSTPARVLEIFTGLSRHHLRDHHDNLIQTFEPELTELQQHVLDLLQIPTSTYTTAPNE